MEIIYPIAGYAPGNYFNKCIFCNDTFTGDKRAVQCEPCAINAVNKNSVELFIKLNKIKTVLQNIRDAKSVLYDLIK